MATKLAVLKTELVRRGVFARLLLFWIPYRSRLGGVYICEVCFVAIIANTPPFLQKLFLSAARDETRYQQRLFNKQRWKCYKIMADDE